MILITFELKGSKDADQFYNEAKIVLENDGFAEINSNTFIKSGGSASSIAEKLRKSGAYQKGCKAIYYTSSLSKK